MALVASEIVADVRGLSLGLTLLTLLVGLALWLFGWRGHRFWAVLVVTVAAGVYGLSEAEVLQTPPLVTGVLLAVTAGMLALALVRVLAFLAAGLTGMLLVQDLVPSLHQPV